MKRDDILSRNGIVPSGIQTLCFLKHYWGINSCYFRQGNMKNRSFSLSQLSRFNAVASGPHLLTVSNLNAILFLLNY